MKRTAFIVLVLSVTTQALEMQAREGTDDFIFLAQKEEEEEGKFVQWISKFGKHYKNFGDWKKKFKNWKKNNWTIIKSNWKALKAKEEGVEDPAMLDHNDNSDKSAEELHKSMGLKHSKVEHIEEPDESVTAETELSQAGSRSQWDYDWSSYSDFIDDAGGYNWDITVDYNGNTYYNSGYSDSSSNSDSIFDYDWYSDYSGYSNTTPDDYYYSSYYGKTYYYNGEYDYDNYWDKAAYDSTDNSGYSGYSDYSGGSSNTDNNDYVPDNNNNNTSGSGDYDWTAYSSPVQSQGGCGSCWAFTGNTVLGARRKIKYGGSRELYSAALPVACAGGNLSGCNGGHAYDLFEWYKDNGTLLENQYPYPNSMSSSGSTGYCQANLNSLTQGVVKSVHFVRKDDPETAMAKLAGGPIGGGFAVADAFYFYSHGIIHPGDGNCESSGSTPNHAMAIVGVQNSASTPHWIIQNSWGSSWGESGTARIAIDSDGGSGNCSMYKYDFDYPEV